MFYISLWNVKGKGETVNYSNLINTLVSSRKYYSDYTVLLQYIYKFPHEVSSHLNISTDIFIYVFTHNISVCISTSRTLILPFHEYFVINYTYTLTSLVLTWAKISYYIKVRNIISYILGNYSRSEYISLLKKHMMRTKILGVSLAGSSAHFPRV